MGTVMLYMITLAFIGIIMVVVFEYKHWNVKKTCEGKIRVRIKPPNKNEYERLCKPIEGDESLKVAVPTRDGSTTHEYTIGNIFYTKYGGFFGQQIATIDYFEGIPDPIIALKTRSMPLTSAKMDSRMRVSNTLDMVSKWQEEHGMKAQNKTLATIVMGCLIVSLVAAGVAIYIAVAQAGIQTDVESVQRALGIGTQVVTPVK